MTPLLSVLPTVDFVLPQELEATEPAESRGSGRDDVRLMVSDRRTDAITHAHFREFPRFLRAGDLLVVNTTATLPSALEASRENGDPLVLHVSTPLPAGLAVVEPRQVAVRAGETIRLAQGGRATILVPYRRSARLWIAQLELPLPLLEFLHRYGRPITYSYIRGRFPIDAYQTVFAREEGSAEMPSAGRAFTRPMIRALLRWGVKLARIVLHAGVASLEHHERPQEEYYEVPARTAAAVRETRERGGRIIAVGTTVVRALESSLDEGGEIIASRGWTDLVITPERGVCVTDGLLTGFHEPKATHLAMLMAFAGEEHLRRAYGEAVSGRYLWHEFGDLHLIL